VFVVLCLLLCGQKYKRKFGRCAYTPGATSLWLLQFSRQWDLSGNGVSLRINHRLELDLPKKNCLPAADNACCHYAGHWWRKLWRKQNQKLGAEAGSRNRTAVPPLFEVRQPRGTVLALNRLRHKWLWAVQWAAEYRLYLNVKYQLNCIFTQLLQPWG